MALKGSGVHGRAEAELGLFFLFFTRTPLTVVVLFILGERSTEFAVDFKCSEWGKVRYPGMVELMPPQAVGLVELAVAESISRVICVSINLKMARYIRSAVLVALFFRV